MAYGAVLSMNQWGRGGLSKNDRGPNLASASDECCSPHAQFEPEAGVYCSEWQDCPTDATGDEKKEKKMLVAHEPRPGPKALQNHTFPGVWFVRNRRQVLCSLNQYTKRSKSA